MLFMAKSNHRRDDLVQSVASSVTAEHMDAASPPVGSDILHAGPRSRTSHALMALGVIVGVLAVLVLPMVFWLSRV